MAKVYFGCSMRGGHGNASREELALIADAIEQLGHELVSRHQVQEGVIEKESKLGSMKIHDRDYNWLQDAGIGIFEVSNPSLGVGAEISDMVQLGKPVLCIFKKGLENQVSAYILGKKGSRFTKAAFEAKSYGNLDEAKNAIKEFLEKTTIAGI